MGSEALPFINALIARGPAVDRDKRVMVYGRFVGAWDGSVTVYRANGEQVSSTCEAYFAWALAGRAIQDVWIAPSRNGRDAGVHDRMYGTTVRIFEPEQDQWRIFWLDPVRQDYKQMIGRQDGQGIVQEYRDAERTICQWCFTDISADAFCWISRESTDERSTWRITSEFRFTRRRRDKDAPGALTGRDANPVRAFDFWSGFWKVTDPETGKAVGDSKVDLILGGRALHEQWSGADGYRGESLNIFDEDRQCWHQSWVSDNGTLLLLDGGMRDGTMDLQGRAHDGERQRIRWSPQPDGSVLQEWESSTDDGKFWRRRFAGLYRKV
jgi:hypothetical protein